MAVRPRPTAETRRVGEEGFALAIGGDFTDFSVSGIEDEKAAVRENEEAVRVVEGDVGRGGEGIEAIGCEVGAGYGGERLPICADAEDAVRFFIADVDAPEGIGAGGVRIGELDVARVRAFEFGEPKSGGGAGIFLDLAGAGDGAQGGELLSYGKGIMRLRRVMQKGRQAEGGGGIIGYPQLRAAGFILRVGRVRK